MNVCLICFRPTVGRRGGEPYHPRCATRLFGSPLCPDTAEIDPIEALGSTRERVKGLARPVGRPGLDVDLSAEGRLQPEAPASARFLLYPQSATYPQMPENESVTMALADRVGVEVQPHGLIALRDGSLALLVRRFDRLDDGSALRVDDFRSLAGGPAGPSTGGPGAASAESAVEIARRHASEPLVALLKLYRLLAGAWWTGNSDVRLDSLALVTGTDRVRRLAPATRLASTILLFPGDSTGQEDGGRTERLARADWLRFGATCGLPARIVDRVLGRMVAAFDDALRLVARSCLSDDGKIRYAEMLGRRTALLER